VSLKLVWERGKERPEKEEGDVFANSLFIQEEDRRGKKRRKGGNR